MKKDNIVIYSKISTKKTILNCIYSKTERNLSQRKRERISIENSSIVPHITKREWFINFF